MTTKSSNLQSSLAAEHARTLERLLRQARDWAAEESLRRRIKQERRQLLTMSDATLADLGITRAEAEAEARRTDIPAERLLSRPHGLKT